jgi:hypothetical protein
LENGVSICMQKLKTHAKEMEEDTKKIGLKRKIK